MSTIENPFAAPQANLQTASDGRTTFYVVSIPKFLTLFFLTSGFYFTYWFYKNWQCYRAATGIKVLALLRTIFSIFFVYSLFMKIRQRLLFSDRPYSWFPRLLALLFIVSACAANALIWVFDPITSLKASCGILILQAVLLTRVQKAVNYLESDPQGQTNARFTGLNGFWVVLGLCWWALAITGVVVLVQ